MNKLSFAIPPWVLCLLLILIPLILLPLISSCSLPPHVLSLDDMMARHGLANEEHYGYKCTAGAHRGASTDHRENSLAALMEANRNDRYAFIEFDVQYSKDARIVIFHDIRMLRLFGSLRSIGNTPFDELSEISNGEIISYEDAIGVLDKKLNIEIKSQGDDLEDRRLADEIIADLKKRGRTKDTLISSISSEIVTYINRNYPEIATGQIFWLTSSTYLPFETLTEKFYEKTGDSQADYLMLHVPNLRNIDDLLKLKPRDKTLVFWDFDDNIFVLHKDFSDRLWGDSTIGAAFKLLHYRLASLF